MIIKKWENNFSSEVGFEQHAVNSQVEQLRKTNLASLLNKLVLHIAYSEWGKEKGKSRIYDQVISSVQKRLNWSGTGLPNPGLSYLWLLDSAALVFFEKRFWVINEYLYYRNTLIPPLQDKGEIRCTSTGTASDPASL